MTNPTQHLTDGQFRGLLKLGDVFAPGNDEFPSFSELGCGEHADAVLEYLPKDDRKALATLLGLLRWTPRFKVRWLVRFLEFAPKIPGPPGDVLRLLRTGLNGVVMSLYFSGRKGQHYSGRTPLEIIEYDVNVYTEDVDARAAATPDGSGSDETAT